MNCEHLTMPASISPRADNAAKHCKRPARWIVKIRRYTGTEHEYHYCTQHANAAYDRVGDQRPIEEDA